MHRNYLITFGSLLMLLLFGSIAAAQDATATPPVTTTIHYVGRGDTLNRIASRYGTTISELLRLNPQITNPNVVYAGQSINVPAPGAAQPVSTAVPVMTVPAQAPLAEQANFTLEYGIDVNFINQDVPALVDNIRSLGMEWVNQEVRWRDLQLTEGGDIDFSTLDGIVDTLDAQGLKILFTVTTAPDWSRSIQEENGPPDDYADFAAFVSEVAARYAGRVDAYEIWNEPNIRSKWKSPVHPISATEYINLLSQGYQAVKEADPDALVISAGLAPTGFNDAFNAQVGNLEVNAIDDRVFLNGLYAAGLANYSDAIGVQPMGWANPPEAQCCTASEGVTTHYESPQFYFLNTLQDYRQIMLQYGDGGTPIWVTKFGWGTSEDIGSSDPINVFVEYTSLAQQADYITRAYQVAAELQYVGPMFLYNLNGCQVQGDFGIESCYYSLLGPTGEPRLAWSTLQLLNKTLPVASPTALPAEATSDLSLEITVEVIVDLGLELTAEAPIEVTVEATAEAGS